MKVVPYNPAYKQDFIDMNKAWISDMFKMEPKDEEELADIETEIARGGQIFFALDDDGRVMSCCMIAPRDDGDWEIMKFATRPEYAGRGVGSAVLKACIDFAKGLGLHRIIIVSNRRCESAVHLYRKFGFREMPVDKEKFPFDRADIAFEMEFRVDTIRPDAEI